MEIKVRPTEESDLDRLLEIRSDPLVDRQQLSDPPTREEVVSALGAEFSDERIRYEWHSILLDNSLAGYVVTTTFTNGQDLGHYLGFNLSPEHWNQGIMRKALTQIIDQLFAAEMAADIVAETTSGNRRCIRLLKSLKFVEFSPGMLFRLQHMWARKSLRWTKLFHLDSTTWNARMEYPTL